MLKLIMTCTSCPEQYDAYLGDTQVGYLRLRHGWFRANVPRSTGKIVYQTEDIEGDGSFATDAERDDQLSKAAEAILDELGVTVDGPSYAIGTAPKR